MKQKIEEAIRTTLVVLNKQSIYIAVDKIMAIARASIIPPIDRDSLSKSFLESIDGIDEALNKKS